MRMFIPALIAASLAVFTSCSAGPVLTDSGAVIAASGRPASDKALDAQRRGPEILAFADVRPGWKIGDLMQGAGYFTRLWVSAAGAQGRVYAWSPPEFIEAKKALYGDSLDQLVREYPTHVVPLRMSFDDLAFPEPLDMVFQSQNYHDLHMARFPTDQAAKLNAAVFRALKSGGAYIIVDHVANASDAAAPDRVHRGDPSLMRREVEAAGFRFVGESDVLRNPEDDHTKHVFDPAIRGRTDQVIYKFRKP
jgi:predicted methyltransferase